MKRILSMQCLDQSQTVKGKSIKYLRAKVSYYNINQTLLKYFVRGLNADWTSAVESDAFSLGLIKTRSQFYFFRKLSQHTWRPDRNSVERFSPSFMGSQGLNSGSRLVCALPTDTSLQPAPSFHLTNANSSLWGLPFPKALFQFIKLGTQRTYS